MGVPRAGAAVGAVEDLHEPHAALDQPPGGEALLAEGLRGGLVEAVQLLRRRRFGGEVDDVGHGGLHAEGQLVRLDPRRERRVVGVLDRRPAG